MANEHQARRVALITGGSRGIGRAVAQRLAADGMDVAVGYVTRLDEAEATVADITSRGGNAISVQVDVASEGSVSSAFDAVESAWGGIDVVVNSAGTMTNAPIAALDLDVLDGLVAVNLRGAFVVTREAARRVRDGGAVVLVSSSVVRLNPPTYGAYAATKAAVETLATIAAKELGPRGVTVNAIAPGPLDTDLFNASNNPESIAMLTGMTPLGRIGRTEDIVGAVSLLAGSVDGRWITGQALHINGGLA